MTLPELRECIKNPLVPRSFIIEATMIRLRKFETSSGDITEEEKNNPRFFLFF
jgi:hypothetical protein